VNLHKTLEQLCNQHADVAVQFLVDTLQDTNAPTSERRRAATELLDRGFGRPVDRQVIAQIGKESHQGSGNSLTSDQLRAIAAGAILDAEGHAVESGQVLDFPREIDTDPGG